MSEHRFRCSRHGDYVKQDERHCSVMVATCPQCDTEMHEWNTVTNKDGRLGPADYPRINRCRCRRATEGEPAPSPQPLNGANSMPPPPGGWRGPLDLRESQPVPSPEARRHAAALQRIVDWSDCQCEHDDGNCCANVADMDYHCPGCIAAVALRGADVQGAPSPASEQGKRVPPDELLTLARAIDSKVYAATPSVRVLARDYLRLRGGVLEALVREWREQSDEAMKNHRFYESGFDLSRAAADLREARVTRDHADALDAILKGERK